MRVNGQEIEAANEDFLVIPRAKGPIIFRGVAVMDFEPFDKMCPVPLPPVLLTKKGKVQDTRDKDYVFALQQHSLKRIAWMVINTLQDVEWSTVDNSDPATWMNWTDEVSKVLSPAEQQRLLNFVLQVNCLDEKKVEAARADFLRGLAQEASQDSSQSSGLPSSPSGEPVNGLESDLPT